MLYVLCILLVLNCRTISVGDTFIWFSEISSKNLRIQNEKINKFKKNREINLNQLKKKAITKRKYAALILDEPNGLLYEYDGLHLKIEYIYLMYDKLTLYLTVSITQILTACEISGTEKASWVNKEK